MATPVDQESRWQRGFAIVDTLLSLIFLVLLAAILQSFAIASMQSLQVRRVADDLQETARIAVEIMSRDIRDTGYGLRGSADGGLRRASATTVSLARDLDLDGATDSSNERIAYELNSETKQLRRRLGNASPQPMVEDLDADQIVFRFRDGRGSEIEAGTDLDDPQRAVVRQIEITLRLSAPHPISGVDPITATHRVSVGLRNGGF